jgi:hypothetical protein
MADSDGGRTPKTDHREEARTSSSLAGTADASFGRERGTLSASGSSAKEARQGVGKEDDKKGWLGRRLSASREGRSEREKAKETWGGLVGALKGMTHRE